MDAINRPAPASAKRDCTIYYVVAALLVGVVIGGLTEWWVHYPDIMLGRCYPIHGTQCVDAINKK